MTERRLPKIPPDAPTIPWAVWLFQQQDREAIAAYRKEQERLEAERKLLSGVHGKSK